MKIIIKAIILIPFIITALIPQARDYKIHNRGMLHETVFNTGEIGRSYTTSTNAYKTLVPLMEWPGNSSANIDQILYDGQHNILGGGIHIAANATDTVNRLYSFCGAVGASTEELVNGVWAFPISISRTENFPVLSDGNLNLAYNPDEAEEIIVAKWGTPTGITVTRTSRAWSYPDYDDFIIYEYEFVNTGNRDADTSTIESQAALSDVLIDFDYGYAPSMFGYMRTYNAWENNDYQDKDQRARFDPSRWLNYNIDNNGKPEKKFYDLWSSLNIYGGGLTSPQAVGLMMLHIDTVHLAHRDQTTAVLDTKSWDLAGHIKQPWSNYVLTSNFNSTKLYGLYTVSKRQVNSISNIAVHGTNWYGRGGFNNRQSYRAAGRFWMFGPYYMKIGDTVRFAVAELAGYGAARLEQTRAGMKDQGGSCGALCGEATDSAFFPVPNWSEAITYGMPVNPPFQYGYPYLKSPLLDSATNSSRYNLPDYVNSNVVTIKEVAEKAKQAYTGDTLPPPYWPEGFVNKGQYKFPITVPSPGIRIPKDTTVLANYIIWGNQVESFSHPRLKGALSHYEVSRSSHPLGPWTKLDSVGIADLRYFSNNEYVFVDTSTTLGESFYYSVISVDVNGNKSGRTNIVLHTTQMKGTATLEKVYVVPNPFFVKSPFSGVSAGGVQGGLIDNKITFYNLPDKGCKIYIYSYSGQLIHTIEHISGYTNEWFQVTRNNQFLASGLYFFVVETPDGRKTHGKFVIIH